MSLSFNLSLPTVRESSKTKCTTPEIVYKELEALRTAAQECFVTITLDTKNRILDKHIVTIGTLNASLAHPREVFRTAISDNAAAIILAHNHPSGDPSPSPEDIRITRQLVEAGKVLEIQVLDHVIIGRPRPADGIKTPYISLRETGLVSFAN
jgi:DNA repair protein RadC